MKKTYNKPQIVFESFELTTSISAGCSYIVTNSADTSNCSYHDAQQDITLFAAHCGWDEDEVNTSGVCYHVPSANYDLFNS